MAIGATVWRAVGFAIRPGILVSSLGVACGLVAALAASRVMQHLVWGVRSTDPSILLGASAAGVLLAILASLGPALRVAGLDPARKLREE